MAAIVEAEADEGGTKPLSAEAVASEAAEERREEMTEAAVVGLADCARVVVVRVRRRRDVSCILEGGCFGGMLVRGKYLVERSQWDGVMSSKIRVNTIRALKEKTAKIW